MNKKALLYFLLAGLMSQSAHIKAMDYDDMSVIAVDKFQAKKKEKNEEKEERRGHHDRRHREKRHGRERKHRNEDEREEREERKERKERKKSKNKSDKKCAMRDEKQSGKKHGWIFSRRNRSKESDK